MTMYEVEIETGVTTGPLVQTDALVLHEEEITINARNTPQIVLKHGDAFLVTDMLGDLPNAQGEIGLFWQGTRFLRSCNFLLEGEPLVPLSWTIAESSKQCRIEATNAPFTVDNEVNIPHGSIHVSRVLELQADALVQTLTITNFAMSSVPVSLSLTFGTDFCDMFDVRGFTRTQRGIRKVATLDTKTTVLGYYGADHVERETAITFTPAADIILLDRVVWQRTLPKGEPVKLQIRVVFDTSDKKQRAPQYLPPLQLPTLYTNDSVFNRFLERSMYDFTMLSTPTPYGYFPYAGIPWFSCPFGRDGLLACLEFLPWFPEVARGALAFLAAHQGTKVEPFTDEEPGKILHEFRTGELANLREIPYIPYYGSVDATPLFLITLEHYIRWTNDIYLLRQLWSNAVAAAQWLLTYGDKDGDGFIEYHKASDKGLVNQGWKDAWDAISHEDGRLAASPIALCEVQGYAFAAYRAMSYLAGRLGKQQEADCWEGHAGVLQQRFLHHFWWEEEQTLYLALDSAKMPCAVVSSNAGHCLWTGIVPAEYAQGVMARLMQDDMYSGWGIRTLSSGAARYNPMSYHNGSVWPHDTAVVGASFAQHNGKTEAGMLLQSLYNASQFQQDYRLPELYCGFAQQAGCGPTRYPRACSPQAWAAGAPFLLLNGLLGLQPQAEQQRLLLVQPTLPTWLHTMEIHGMKVRGENVHLHVVRDGDTTDVIAGDDNQVDIHVL